MKKIASLFMVITLVLCLCFSMSSCSGVELKDDDRTGETEVTEEIWNKYVNLAGVDGFSVDYYGEGYYDIFIHGEETDDHESHYTVKSTDAVFSREGFGAIALPFQCHYFSSDVDIFKSLSFSDFEYDDDTRSYIYECEFELPLDTNIEDRWGVSEFDLTISVKFEDDVLTRIDLYAENSFLFIFDMIMTETFVFTSFN